MPTYSAPIQPPTQPARDMLFDLVTATGGVGDATSVSGAATTWSGAIVPVAGIVPSGYSYAGTFRGHAETPAPISLSITRDTISDSDHPGVRPHYNAVTSKVRFAHPSRPPGLLGPLYADTPVPDGATGWRLDPDDTTGGAWVGDYTFTINWRMSVGSESNPHGNSIGVFSAAPGPLPTLVGTLRLMPASQFSEGTNASGQWIVSDFDWPGAPLSGTVLHQKTHPGGPSPSSPSNFTDYGADVVTVPDPGGTLALFTSLDIVETTAEPARWYANPPYYIDFWIANCYLTVTRAYRPQRYQWVFPDVEVSYPIGEQRRSSASAFLGRRR